MGGYVCSFFSPFRILQHSTSSSAILVRSFLSRSVSELGLLIGSHKKIYKEGVCIKLTYILISSKIMYRPR